MGIKSVVISISKNEWIHVVFPVNRRCIHYKGEEAC